MTTKKKMSRIANFAVSAAFIAVLNIVGVLAFKAKPMSVEALLLLGFIGAWCSENADVQEISKDE